MSGDRLPTKQPPALRDRFGLGFRPELASGVIAHLDRLDVVELIAETLVHADHRRRSALRMLARQSPVLLHGVSLGLASAADVEPARLELLARIADWLEPEQISEHLAFVRAGGVEIGHLAAPPRSPETIEGAARNLARARDVLGRALLVENVATLIEPPASAYDEPAWVSAIAQASGAELLLDLQNLFANACNFGDGLETARALLQRLPLERVRVVHLAGGRLLARAGEHRAPRLLDDHMHPVPDEVFALLAELAANAPQPLTVLIERDGAYPPFGELLAEVDRARLVVKQARARALTQVA